MPSCDDCRPGEICEKRVSILADGSTIRHDDPPHPVVSWPCCPWQHESLWVVHAWPGGEQWPSAFCSWAVARGLQRKRLTAGGALILRDYLFLRGLPRQVSKAKAWSEVNDGGK